VFRIRADDPHDSFAADNLAILTNPPNAAAHLHDQNPLVPPGTDGESGIITHLFCYHKRAEGEKDCTHLWGKMQGLGQ
jgi:hypothetical protein